MLLELFEEADCLIMTTAEFSIHLLHFLAVLI